LRNAPSALPILIFFHTTLLALFTKELLPLYTPEIYNQVIDLPVEKPPLIFITEKGYLELKSEVGYWQAMHQKACENFK
jgi:hypothetical protein